MDSTVRQLNTSGGKNRFKFRSFNERIQEIRIDAGRRVIKDLEEPEEWRSYFEEALLKWRELDCSTDFTELFDKLNPLSKSLGQILYQRRIIVKIILEALKKEDNISLVPTLELLATLFKDLNEELYPQFNDITNCILTLVSNRDPKVVESAFTCLSYIFKHLKNPLLKEINSTFSQMQPFLSHTKPYIRMFSADAFSFLMRKLHSEETTINLITKIMKALRSNPTEEFSLGLSVLFFEVMKSPNESLRPSFARDMNLLLKTVFSSTVSVIESDITLSMLQQLFTLLSHHVDTQHYKMLLDTLSQFKYESQQENNKSNVIGKQSILLNLVINIKRGTMIQSSKKPLFLFAQETLELYTEMALKTINTSAKSAELHSVLGFSASLLALSSMDSCLAFGKPLLETIFKINSLPHVFAFISLLKAKKWELFAKITFPLVITYLNDNWKQSHIVCMKLLMHLFEDEHFDLKSQLPSLYMNPNLSLIKIDYKLSDENNHMYSFLNQQISEMKKQIKQSNKSNTEKKNAVKRDLVIRCLGHLDIQTDGVFETCVQSLLNMISNPKVDTITKMHLLKTICLRVDVTNDSHKELMRSLINPVFELCCANSQLVPCLEESWNFLCKLRQTAYTPAASSTESMPIFSTLENNLQSSNSSIRKFSALIMKTLIDHGHQNIEDANTMSETFGDMVKIEDIPLDVGSLRDRTMVVRKLERRYIPKEDGTMIPDKAKILIFNYFLGLMYTSMAPFVNEAAKSISSVLSSNDTLLWSIYNAKMTEIRSFAFGHQQAANPTCLHVDMTDGMDETLKVSLLKTTKYAENIFQDRLIYRIQEQQERVQFNSIWQEPNIIERYVRETLSSSKNGLTSTVSDEQYWQLYLKFIRIFQEALSIFEKYATDTVGRFEAAYNKLYDQEGNEIDAKTASNTKEQGEPRWKLSMEVMEFLDILSKCTRIKNFPQQQNIWKMCMHLLTNGNASLQEKALSCILNYNYPHLKPIDDRLKKLVKDSSFRDSLSQINMENFYMDTKPEHQSDIMTIISRILYGKAISRKDRNSSKHGIQQRRTAIFAFMASWKPEHIKYMTELMNQSFGGSDVSLEKMDKIFLPNYRVQLGYLAILEDFMKQLQTRLIPVLPSILPILLRIMSQKRNDNSMDRAVEENDASVPDDEENDNNESSYNPAEYMNIKTVHQRLIKCLILLFKMDLDFDLKPCVPIIFQEYLNQKLVFFETENSQSVSITMDLLTTWSASRHYVTLYAEYPVLLKKVSGLLSAKKVHLNVVSALLNIYENIFEVLVEAKETVDYNQEQPKEKEEKNTLDARMMIESDEKMDEEVDLALIKKHQEQEEALLNASRQLEILLRNEADFMLTQFKEYFFGCDILSSSTYHRKDGVPNRLLNALSFTSQFAQNAAETADTLLTLLLPLLKRPASTVPEQVKIQILFLIENFVSSWSSSIAFEDLHEHRYYVTIARLFSQVKTSPARRQLVQVVKKMSGCCEKLKDTAELLNEMNCFEASRLDQPDYENMFKAFKTLEKQNVFEWGCTQWLPILNTLVFHVHDDQEYAVRLGSAAVLKTFIENVLTEDPTIDDRTESLRNLLMHMIFPSIKNGFKSHQESVRSEFVGVLKTLVECSTRSPEYERFTWTNLKPLLSDGDGEANFFSNIYHLQLHRRSRAIRRFSSMLEEIAVPHLKNIFIPIFMHFVSIPKDVTSFKAEQQQIVNDSVKCIALCSKQLGWSGYFGLVNATLDKIERAPEQEKVTVRLLVDVLEQFHFELVYSEPSESSVDVDNTLVPDITQAPASPSTSVSEANKVLVSEVEVTEQEQQLENNGEKEEEDDDDDKVGKEEEEENSKQHQEIEKVAEGQKICQAVMKRLLPRLQRLILKKLDDTMTVRIPIALSLAQILKKMPLALLRIELPKLVLNLCNLLRSRMQSTRDTARQVLADSLKIMGPEYLSFYVKELKFTLTRGYQLHVLGWTVHSLLATLLSSLGCTSHVEIDTAIRGFVPILIEDIFGEAGTEREVEELKGKMKEIKSCRSYNSFELLASFVSCTRYIQDMLMPTKEIMIESKDTKVIHKITEILRHVQQGVIKNKAISLQSKLKFAVKVADDTIFSSLSEKELPKQEVGTKNGVPEHFAVRLSSKEKVPTLKYFQANAHHFVEFGLSLFLSLFRKEVTDASNPKNIALVNSIVPIFGKALYSKEDSIVTISFRLFGTIVKVKSSKKLDESIPVLFKRSIEIIAKGASRETPVVQAASKLLVTLLRERPDTNLKTTQVVALLNMLQSDMTEPTKHMTSFTLIRLLVAKKYLMNEVYTLMDQIRELMVTSQSTEVREICRSIFVQFLLDYPHSEKSLEKQILFLVNNLQYEHETGRQSALEAMNMCLRRFPTSTVMFMYQIIFVSLVAVMMNDTSKSCREMAAMVIRGLMRKADMPTWQKIWTMIQGWYKSKDSPSLLRVGAQLIGQLFSTEEGGNQVRCIFELKQMNPETVVESMRNVLQRAYEDRPIIKRNRDGGEDSEDENEDEDSIDQEYSLWEPCYYTISAVTKMIEAGKPELSPSLFSPLIQIMAELVLYPHSWISSVVSKLFGLLFSKITEPIELLNYLDNEACQLLCIRFMKQLSKTVDVDMQQLVKNLFFLMKVFEAVEEKQNKSIESVGDAIEELFTIKLIYRLHKLSQRASVWKKKKGHQVRKCIFQIFAATSQVTSKEKLAIMAEYMITSLYTVQNDSTDLGREAESLKILSSEVLELIQTQLRSSSIYLEIYNKVHKKSVDIRNKRKELQVVEKITNPEMTLKRKQRKNEKEKTRKKQKIEKFRKGKMKERVSKGRV